MDLKRAEMGRNNGKNGRSIAVASECILVAPLKRSILPSCADLKVTTSDPGVLKAVATSTKSERGGGTGIETNKANKAKC